MRLIGVQKDDDKFMEVSHHSNEVESQECDLSVVSSMTMINSILVGLSDFFNSRKEESERVQEYYYQREYVERMEDPDELWHQVQERSVFRVGGKKWQQ